MMVQIDGSTITATLPDGSALEFQLDETGLSFATERLTIEIDAGGVIRVTLPFAPVGAE